MSKKHLEKLKRLTGFWFNPKATEYLLSIPSHLKPVDPGLKELMALEARIYVLRDVLDSFPELSTEIPKDPYREGFRDGHKDLRRCVLHLLEKTKREIEIAQVTRSQLLRAK